MRRWFYWGSLLLFLGVIILVWQLAPNPVSAAPHVPINLLQIEKPVDNWIVCRDLGVGDVPGLPQPRQRVQLCHEQGWRVNTYCLRPEAPVPLVGTRCQRINENTYWCGNGLQPLREYRIVDQPPETPTPTATSVFVNPPPDSSKRTATPDPFLPATGEPPANRIDWLEWVFPGIFLVVIAVLIGLTARRSGMSQK